MSRLREELREVGMHVGGGQNLPKAIKDMRDQPKWEDNRPRPWQKKIVVGKNVSCSSSIQEFTVSEKETRNWPRIAGTLEKLV